MNGRVVTGALALAVTLAGALAAHYEGDVPTAYQDTAGVYTICEGHTKGVKPGDTATPEQCAEYKAADLADASDAVDACVRVPLTVGERAAYVDFVFNVGGSAFCGSTLVRKLAAGDRVGACNELSRWTHAGGKVLPGLVKRRESERELCLRDITKEQT